MTKVGSMQSNDLLIEYSEDRSEFQLINTVRILDDEFVIKAVKEILKGIQINTNNLKIFFCGANEWVIRARGLALIEVLKKGEMSNGL